MRRRRAPAEIAPPGVEVVFFQDAVRLVTFRVGAGNPVPAFTGAIVRVIPEASTSPEQRVDLKAALLREGALHVWFAPAATAPATAPLESARAQAAPEEPVRAVVHRLVEAAHTADRERLRAVVDAALSAEGA